MTLPALETLASDLWVARRPLPLVMGDVGTRMTVMRLRRYPTARDAPKRRR